MPRTIEALHCLIPLMAFSSLMKHCSGIFLDALSCLLTNSTVVWATCIFLCTVATSNNMEVFVHRARFAFWRNVHKLHNPAKFGRGRPVDFLFQLWCLNSTLSRETGSHLSSRSDHLEDAVVVGFRRNVIVSDELLSKIRF